MTAFWILALSWLPLLLAVAYGLGRRNGTNKVAEEVPRVRAEAYNKGFNAALKQGERRTGIRLVVDHDGGDAA